MPTTDLRVLVLFGTRPELIKLAPVIGGLERDARFELLVVSTSQHREMLEGLPDLFSIEPDFDLGIDDSERTLAEISSRALGELDPLLRRRRPDLVLVQGDTTSAFAGALAAFYNGIPVGHVEAGLRSGDRQHPFPEEINRRLISAVADLHFAPLESNERRLLDEGVDPSTIFVTGNTVIDSLQEMRARSQGALDPHLPPEARDGRRLVLVTAHRRESLEAHLAELCHALRELASAYPDLLVVYPVHVNPEVRATVQPLLDGRERILLLDPLPYDAFVDAMSRAHLIVTDSGGIQEEAPMLDTPVLVFRRLTERGEGVAARGARLVGLDRGSLVAAASRLLDDEAAYRRMTGKGRLYGDGRASRRIVQAILHRFAGAERPERFTPTESARA